LKSRSRQQSESAVVSRKYLKIPFCFTLVFVFLISIPSKAENISFSVPSIFRLTYPQSFAPEQSQLREARLKEAIQIFSRSGLKTSIEVNEILDLLVLKSKDAEYAHISFSAFPPQATQEDIKAANNEQLNMLANELEENFRAGYRGNGISVTTGFTSKRHTLSDGTVAFLVEHVYKMPDGRIRTNQKYFIYTYRFTLIIGITTSPDISSATRSEIEDVVRSVIVSK
jgi:hypothetical protein